MKDVLINPAKITWKEIVKRPVINDADLRPAVQSIMNEVKIHGDTAIRKFTLEFEGIVIHDLKVTDTEIDEAELLVPAPLKNAIAIATKNIWKFHNSQIEEIKEIETMPGVTCWRKSVGIEKVGLYIPGGSAPLFSTLLMLGIPATIAGCTEIVVCTPADKNGKIHPAILYASKLLGITKIYKAGGSQAIAAMAYGTETIPEVYKIFGPGNQYVTCAKQMVNAGGIAIDMPAGPSEIAIFADESCHPSFVAADLLSQAEHGVDSQVLLVASSESITLKIKEQIELQAELLSRKEIILQSLQNSHFIVMEDVEAAFELLNLYAPEHLILATDNAEELCKRVVNAGSVFIGHYSPESAGDYASGTNHTLPTNGFARNYSGVSLDSFVKKITFQKVTKEGLDAIGETVQTMAVAEGLDAHANAVQVRRNITG